MTRTPTCQSPWCIEADRPAVAIAYTSRDGRALVERLRPHHDVDLYRPDWRCANCALLLVDEMLDPAPMIGARDVRPSLVLVPAPSAATP